MQWNIGVVNSVLKSRLLFGLYPPSTANQTPSLLLSLLSFITTAFFLEYLVLEAGTASHSSTRCHDCFSSIFVFFIHFLSTSAESIKWKYFSCTKQRQPSIKEKQKALGRNYIIKNYQYIFLDVELETTTYFSLIFFGTFQFFYNKH